MKVEELTREGALELDASDPLATFRKEFIIPTKADLKSTSIHKLSTSGTDNTHGAETSLYMCGNSLGVQPRLASQRVNEHFLAWAKKGVTGHFRGHTDTPLPPFLDDDERASRLISPLVGANISEVVAMETLTANLQLMMTSFYRPTKEKYKIILEGKAFPSDHYAVESQIRIHGLDPATAMVTIDPIGSRATIPTEQILATIDEHAESTALILLPGIQYYTGQLLDIKTVTAHAHSKGILIGWDLAHAVGNVPLKLHDWDADFAVWCHYKYVNAGPGAIGGLFVHDRHGLVDKSKGPEGFRPRLAGWWGGDKSLRFEMNPSFVPTPGAAGYQVGNTCAIACTVLTASLEIFGRTSMQQIREKSVSITGFLEKLLLAPFEDGGPVPYQIITPSDPTQRGAQLSVQLNPGLMDGVMEELEAGGAVIDERRPDVIRIAPAPLYNTYEDVWNFVSVFKDACRKAEQGSGSSQGDKVMLDGGKNEKE